MIRQARTAAFTLSLLWLGGCAAIPGVSIDEESTLVDGRPLEIQPITGQLVERLAAERVDANAVSAPEEPDDYRYVVGAGDVLAVIVWGHPELTNPFGQSTAGVETSGRLVREDGTLTIPYVGEIQAEGRSVGEIQEDIREGLKVVIEEPQVTVRVIEFRSQRVYVTGEVASPGMLPITDRPLTVLDALSEVGGFIGRREERMAYGADEREALLTRNGQTRAIDLHALYRQGIGNATLRHGDILHVPDDWANKVFVVGEVGRQQSVPLMRGRLSLAEAISEAEGISLGTANTRAVYVIRGVPRDRDGRATLVPEVYQLDARDATALLLADAFPLQPRDVVLVSTAGIVHWNRVMEQIFPTIRAAWQIRQLGRGIDL